MAVIGIQYKEGSKKKNLSYKSVEISYGNNLKKKKVFNSGDFVKDWYDCTKFMITEISDSEHILHSSTVNHFIMDGADFDSARLKADDETAKLVYKYRPDIELFVAKGTQPTWNELRELCGDPTKKK